MIKCHSASNLGSWTPFFFGGGGHPVYPVIVLKAVI